MSEIFGQLSSSEPAPTYYALYGIERCFVINLAILGIIPFNGKTAMTLLNGAALLRRLQKNGNRFLLLIENVIINIKRPDWEILSCFVDTLDQGNLGKLMFCPV